MAIRTVRTSSWLKANTNLPTTGAWTLCTFAKLNTDHDAYSHFLGVIGHSPVTNLWDIQTDSTGTALELYSQTERSLGVSISVGEWFFCAIRKPGANGGHGIIIKLDSGN